MTKFEERLERATCRKLVKLTKKAPSISDALDMYARAHAYYIKLVRIGDGSHSSGVILADHVAYTNALARYCTLRGVPQKEIR